MLVLGKHPLDCRSHIGYLSSFTLTQCDQPWGGCLNSLNTMFSLMWSEDSNILHVIRRDRWLMGPDSEQELLKESSHLRVGESLTGEQVPSCLLCSPHPSVCPNVSVSLLFSIDQDHHPQCCRRTIPQKRPFGSLSLLSASVPLYFIPDVR